MFERLERLKCLVSIISGKTLQALQTVQTLQFLKYGFFIPAVAMCLGCFFFSCGNENDRAEGDRILAKVYDKSLYLSDMNGMLPPGIASEDSSLIINKFVKNWIREAAMLHEAERNIPKDIDIDQLVADYRASLIKHNYENILLDQFLDSTITKVELEKFYEKNKEQYRLETPIIRCHFVKAKITAPQINELEKWWKNGDVPDLGPIKNWCKSNGAVHFLDDNTWHKVVDIAVYLPQGTLTVDNAKKKKNFIEKDNEFIYLYRRLEFIPKGELPPLSYIEDQARKVILHKRKTELLDEMKGRLYDEATRRNSVTVYE